MVVLTVLQCRNAVELKSMLQQRRPLWLGGPLAVQAKLQKAGLACTSSGLRHTTALKPSVVAIHCIVTQYLHLHDVINDLRQGAITAPISVAVDPASIVPICVPGVEEEEMEEETHEPDKLLMPADAELPSGPEDVTGPLAVGAVEDLMNPPIDLFGRLVRMRSVDFNASSSNPEQQWTGQITKVYPEKFPAPRSSLKVGSRKVEEGAHVEVWWPADKKWYPATVRSFGKARGRVAFQVKYPDGDDGGTGGWVTSADEWRERSPPPLRDATYNVEVYFPGDRDCMCIPASSIRHHVLEWYQLSLAELKQVQQRATSTPIVNELRARTGNEPGRRGCAQALYKLLHSGEMHGPYTSSQAATASAPGSPADDAAPVSGTDVGASETAHDPTNDTFTLGYTAAIRAASIRSMRMALASHGVCKTLALSGEGSPQPLGEPVFLYISQSVELAQHCRECSGA